MVQVSYQIYLGNSFIRNELILLAKYNNKEMTIANYPTRHCFLHFVEAKKYP